MKKYIPIAILSVIISQTITAQVKEPTLQLYKNGEIIQSFKVNDIDSLKIEEVQYPSVVDGICVDQEVDLGLSAMWCGYNFGATSPEQAGGYYACGESITKDSYYESNYSVVFPSGVEYFSGSDYDVVSKSWGDDWHIPTNAELEELLKCKKEIVTYNGVTGVKYTGPNGNSIFLPFVGYKKGTSVHGSKISGYYMSGTLGANGMKFLHVSTTGIDSHDIYSWCGLPIRPVKSAIKVDPNMPMPYTFTAQLGFSSLEKDEMVFVEGGTFTMGATSEQGSDAYSDEKPTHQVTVSDFYIGKYEVTQQLWEFVMKYSGKCADGSTMSAYSSDVWLGSNPSSSYGKGNYYPAYYVSYNDIVDVFIPRLNKITGKTFRLPTEAEWEYAARGGNKSKGYKYSGSNTIGDVAWYTVNSYDVGSSDSNYGTHTVGTKAPNELGLYDMSGNVWEWCSDWYDSSYYSTSPSVNPTGPSSGSSRVFRGGGWSYSANYCRVSFRHDYAPGSRYNFLGFRLVLP